MTEKKNHSHKTSSSAKDVIYVDVEDDITGIVEKVRASSHHIVALVLPKRATMLQSIVNMKLLKRAGGDAKKKVVLITAEAGLLPLAGSVGLYVAKSLQTKPEIPEAPEAAPEKPETVNAEDAEEQPVDKSKTLGELSGSDDEPIELDNADKTPEDDKSAKSKSKKDSKIKIPNFNKFRMWLILGGLGVVVLIGLAIWAFMVLPKAEVVISTDSSAVTSSRELTLSTADDAQLNADEGVVPAQSVETTRTQRAEVAATGEENQGDKASGSVTMTAENCDSLTTPEDVPAGTGVISDGKTYITQETASFSGSGTFDGSCINFEDSDISIEAQNAGSSFNTSSSTNFNVVGRSDVSASGSASGGTDDIVKVVSQEDVDKARDQIESQDNEDVEQELQEDLESEGLFAIAETFNVSTSEADISAQVGDEADNVTVTEEVSYTMLGVNREDLERVIAADVADRIDTARQTILDYGLNEASFTMQNQQDGETLVGARSVVVAGPDLNIEEIKEQIAGKKASEARSIIEENPGVTNVDISYGPFWVRSIPGSADKITVTVEEPEVVPEENNNGAESAE